MFISVHCRSWVRPCIDATYTKSFKVCVVLIDFSYVIPAANHPVMNLSSHHVVALIFRTSQLNLQSASSRVLALPSESNRVL